MIIVTAFITGVKDIVIIYLFIDFKQLLKNLSRSCHKQKSSKANIQSHVCMTKLEISWLLHMINIRFKKEHCHKGWTILFLRGGGVGQLPKKNSCIAKVKKKKIMHSGPGKKKIRASLSTGRILLEQIKR